MTTDLLDPELRVSGIAIDVAATLRAERGPVFRVESGDLPGYWAVIGHAEAREVLTDPARFTSTRGTRPRCQRPPGTRLSLHNLDPPEHTPLRRVATRLIEPESSADLLERARARLRALAGRGGFDAVAEIGVPLATEALARALGIAADDAYALARISDGAHDAAADALVDAPDAAEALARLHAALDAELARVFADPPPVAAHLDVRDRRALMRLLVQAGWVTAVDTLAGALERLAELTPSALTVASLDVAVEEMLRVLSPINQFARSVAADGVTLAGHDLRRGEQVVVFFAAANRDPRVFEDPDALRLDRSPNPHLAFGAGPHRCPGATLARRQLRALLEAMPTEGLWPVAAGPVLRRRSAFLNGFDALPLRLDRG